MVDFAKTAIMKTSIAKLHTILVAGIILTGIIFINSCGNSNTGNNAQNMADSAMAKVDTAAKEIKQGAENLVNNGNPDSNFVVKAALTNNAELRILQAGLDNGTNKELKMHARMMIADHKTMGKTVKAYSTKKGYTLPDTDNGKADDELAKLGQKAKGADWDKEWVDHMVSAHKDCIDMFESGKNNAKDAELKTIIDSALPILHSHLDMMKQLQDKMGK